MIIFFGSFPVIMIVIIFLAFLNAGARAVIDLLPVLFCVFLAKNFMLDIGIAAIKHRRKFFLVVIFLLFDTFRDFLFFNMLHLEALDYSGMSGLIEFFLLLVIGSIFFLIGELASIAHAFREFTQRDDLKLIMCGDIFSNIMLVGIYMLFSFPWQ